MLPRSLFALAALSLAVSLAVVPFDGPAFYLDNPTDILWSGVAPIWNLPRFASGGGPSPIWIRLSIGGVIALVFVAAGLVAGRTGAADA